jgi:hypothetical protein
MARLAAVGATIPALAALSTTVSAAPAAASGTYLAACSFSTPEMAPGEWSPGCVGASPLYVNLAWSGWGTERSEASGEALLNDCDPGCATGTTYRYPAQLSAYRPRPCPARPGDSQYTRVESRELLPAGNPLGLDPGWSSSVWKVDASACTALLPTFEQGTGVVLDKRPRVVDASRNIRPGSISGLDSWVIRKWLSFGGPRAVASAVYWWHTPDGSNFRRFAARVVLGGVQHCGTLYAYTRISGRFLGRKPSGLPRTIHKAPYFYDC